MENQHNQHHHTDPLTALAIFTFNYLCFHYSLQDLDVIQRIASLIFTCLSGILTMWTLYQRIDEFIRKTKKSKSPPTE